MMEDTVIRSYSPSDLQAIMKIHEDSGLDYKFPSMGQFPVLKVLDEEGHIRAAYGMKQAVEAYFWMDRSTWADAEQKWLTVKALDKEAVEAAKDLNIDSVFCCIPPSMHRFGRRISNSRKGLGFSEIRPNWKIYTKLTGGQR